MKEKKNMSPVPEGVLWSHRQGVLFTGVQTKILLQEIFVSSFTPDPRSHGLQVLWSGTLPPFPCARLTLSQ